MKVEISRKDALELLRDLKSKLLNSGDLATAVAVELGRASIKRVTTLAEIRYIDTNGMYMDVGIQPENNDPKFPASESK